MDYISSCYKFLFSDYITTLISLSIGYLVFKIASFYVKVLDLPPGPIPVPIFGNAFSLKGTGKHWTVDLQSLADKYGPVFTFWMGSRPSVFIADIDLARDAFRRSEFAGRSKSIFARKVSNKDYTDVTFADYGNQWEALRRVAHSAVQKYASTDKLVYLVSDVVDRTVDTIIEKEGVDTPFETKEYFYYLFLNILASSAFGRIYDLDEPEFLQIKYCQKDFFEIYGNRFLYWEFFEISRKFDAKGFNHFNKIYDDFIDMIRRKYKNHYKDYDQSIIRDFCDTLITAKNEALREGKYSAPYLKDENLAMAIFDLFFAGNDTSETTFQWIVFLLTYYPDIQKKLRQEIESEIGDRMPTHEDRNRCHYVMAFISETMRFRNAVPMGVTHKALVNSKIGNHSIKKDQEVYVFQASILLQDKYWSDAKEFRPERFLENGKYLSTRPKAFIPFGVGRRVCLGEKLAIADLFLVLVRFLQKTADYELVLYSHNGLDIDPNDSIRPNPKPYKLVFKDK